MKSTRKGFTLVELIVVIAILAILAGVAIPLYSGYIKKANQAADNQLLGVVNSAFGAGCVENGTFPTKFADGTVTLSVGDDKKITGVVVTALPTASDDVGTLSAKINVSFLKYYGANGDTQLKYYYGDGNPTLVFKDGAFCSSDTTAAATLSVTINGKTYTYTQAQVDTYKSSNYNNVQPIELTTSVDSLATALGANKGGLASLANTANFNAALVSLGVVEEGTTFTASMLNDPDLAKKVANASVLYVADTASKMDPDLVYDAFLNGNIGDLVEGTGVDSSFVTAALQYGLLTAFVNTDIGAEYKEGFMADSANVTGLTSVTNLFNKYTMDEDTGTYDAYQYYLSSGDASNDIKGFLSALEIINENASNFDLTSAYSDEAILAAVNSILGNN